VVLMIALIMLVAMTLAGLALMRSVDTSNLIAGNLAFQQAAANYGDVATKKAFDWLLPLSIADDGTLDMDDPGNGYASSIHDPDPAINESWDHFWINTLVPYGVKQAGFDSGTGNTAYYVIQRMCSVPNVPRGNPAPLNFCAKSTTTVTIPGKVVGVPEFTLSDQVLYRITSRITGPHNTVSYIQTIVAI